MSSKIPDNKDKKRIKQTIANGKSRVKREGGEIEEKIESLGEKSRYIVVLGWMHNADEAKKIISKELPIKQNDIYKWDAGDGFGKAVLNFVSIWGRPLSIGFLGLGVLGGLMAVLKVVRTLLKSWSMAKSNADKEGKRLADKLLKNPEKLSETVLIGHSLGGRIIVRALSELSKKGKKIKGAILLGAAISNRDEDLKSAAKATICGVKNYINKMDFVLRVLYENMGEKDFDVKNLREFLPNFALPVITIETFFKAMGTPVSEIKALGTVGNGFRAKNWKDIQVENSTIKNHFFENYWESVDKSQF